METLRFRPGEVLANGEHFLERCGDVHISNDKNVKNVSGVVSPIAFLSPGAGKIDG